MIEFQVQGKPRPAGSKRAIPYRKGDGKLGVRVIDDANGAEWRQDVKLAARRAIGEAPPLAGPVSVQFTFWIPRPQGHFGKRGLLDSAPSYPAKRPDLLKLARAVEDALTGIVWIDDAQIVDETLAKVYSAGPEYMLSVMVDSLGNIPSTKVAP